MNRRNEYKSLEKILTENLSDLRDAMGLTQSQLAERVGVTREHIRMYETGRRVMSRPYYLAFMKIFENDVVAKSLLTELGLIEAADRALPDTAQHSVYRGVAPPAGRVEFQMEYNNISPEMLRESIRAEMRRYGIPEQVELTMPVIGSNGRLLIIWNPGDAALSFLQVSG